MTRRLLIAIALGFALAVAASRVTAIGVWTLVPWGLAAFALGWRASLRSAAISGAAYGFVLGLTFMIAVYTGADPVTRKLPGFVLLSVFAAACGLLGAVAGARISSRGARPRVPPSPDAG